MIEPRLAGTFKMPNDLGAYLVIVLPIAIGYFVTSWRVTQKLEVHRCFRDLLCAMGANLALTLTRAAWIGVFAATLYIAIYFQRKLLWGLLALALLSPS